MNSNAECVNLIPSDYSLIYSCVVKYQSVQIDRRTTKSIHYLLDNSANSLKVQNGEKESIDTNSSLESNFNCNCSAIHYQSVLQSANDNTETRNQKSLIKTSHLISGQNFNQNSLKTASTSTVNSKLKSTGRLSSASGGHRMPNSNAINFNKNANQHNSTANKINESVGVNQQHQTSKNQAKQAQPTKITDQDAIQLLAEDVESRLEALLRTFIQEEKLRQEARFNSLMGKRSASLNALNSEYSDINQNSDYSSPTNRPNYNQHLSNKNALANKNSNSFGYIKPQQHRMQQSYHLQNSQNVNTQPQQKTTAIKSSHRLDSSPSRSPSRSSSHTSNNSQSSKVTKTRSPSPTGRSSSSSQAANIIPVNRNNLFGQHTRSDQNQKHSNASSNKPVNYLNLHQRSQSPTKDNQSSQLNKSYLQANNNQQFLEQQHLSPYHHRLYSQNNKIYDPFSTNNLQFGRSKDDSHIRRVVVYNLNKDASSVEKKPVIIEQKNSISMNGTLDNNVEKIGANLNDNKGIRLRSAKVRANSPSRVGMINNSAGGATTAGVNTISNSNLIGQNLQSNLKQQQTGNASVLNRIGSNNNGSANTQHTNFNSSNKLSGSSNLNNSNISGNISSGAVKKLSSTGSKVTTTSATTNSNRLNSGHENSSLQQFAKDQNNNLDSNSPQLNVGVGSAAQLNTERKVVRKVIVKELDALNCNKKSESVVNRNSNLNNKTSSPSTTYQQQQQRLSPISNGDLNNVAKMATTLNQQPISTSSNLNNNNKSSLDALLSERDRIYKLRNNNVLSSSDANNNYILAKNNSKYNNSILSNDSLSSSLLNTNNSSSSAAGLLNSTTNLNNLNNDVNQSASRNLPLSSSSLAKRKPLIDRYSPFSLVNEAKQKWEKSVIKNGMNGVLSNSKFNYLDENLVSNYISDNTHDNNDNYFNDNDNDLILNEIYEQSDEEIVDSSMVLIRSRLSRLLNTNGNIENLPNSAIISLLNHLSDKNKTNDKHSKPLPALPLPACLTELNKNEFDSSMPNNNNLPQNHDFNAIMINSMRPPPLLKATGLFDCMLEY